MQFLTPEDLDGFLLSTTQGGIMVSKSTGKKPLSAASPIREGVADTTAIRLAARELRELAERRMGNGDLSGAALDLQSAEDLEKGAQRLEQARAAVGRKR